MRVITLLFLFFSIQLQAQHKFEGVWQGLLIQKGTNLLKSYIVWFEFNIDNNGDIKGFTRDEAPNSQFYAFKKLKGKVSGDTVEFKQILIEKQSNSASSYWCLANGTLIYNDSTGYLRGPWDSYDCKRTRGEIVLIRSEHKLSKTKDPSVSHKWRDDLIQDLTRGKNAPEIRKKERENFVFTPIYFDHDQDTIKQEFKKYLSKMAEIVEDHSDLRIKIIGHTDSNGTDEYNVGLSERRAANVKKFFLQHHVKGDKIVIEFKGEKDPINTNSSAEGRKQNRRVDFEFI